MRGLLIPDDWDEVQDGYCTMQLTVPNSPYWRATMKGAIRNLIDTWRWDDETGDPATAAAIAEQAADTITYDCP